MTESKAGFREKNGKLEYRFTHHNKQYSVTGATQKECKAKAQKRIDELSKGLKQDAKSITWEQYCKEWLKMKEITVKKGTIHSYKKKLKMVSDLNKKKMIDLDRRDIIQLQSDLKKKYASSTANWLISKVREICESAIADKIIVSNPAARIRAIPRTEPKATTTIHRALSEAEQAKFFARAKKKNSWYLELFELMIVTGMRVGEAGGLVWGDIDNYIHVRNTVTEVGDGIYEIGPAKTAAAVRDLPLTKDAKDILARQKIKLAQHKGIAACAPDQPVFISCQEGTLINSSMIDSAMELICERVGIEKVSSHALRDTYATRCILQGMQPNTLKTLMGHTKIAITMDLYAQVKPENMEEAMKNISIL